MNVLRQFDRCVCHFLCVCRCCLMACYSLFTAHMQTQTNRQMRSIVRIVRFNPLKLKTESHLHRKRSCWHWLIWVGTLSANRHFSTIPMQTHRKHPPLSLCVSRILHWNATTTTQTLFTLHRIIRMWIGTERWR